MIRQTALYSRKTHFSDCTLLPIPSCDKNTQCFTTKPTRKLPAGTKSNSWKIRSKSGLTSATTSMSPRHSRCKPPKANSWSLWKDWRGKTSETGFRKDSLPTKTSISTPKGFSTVFCKLQWDWVTFISEAISTRNWFRITFLYKMKKYWKSATSVLSTQWWANWLSISVWAVLQSTGRQNRAEFMTRSESIRKTATTPHRWSCCRA